MFEYAIISGMSESGHFSVQESHMLLNTMVDQTLDRWENLIKLGDMDIALSPGLNPVRIVASLTHVEYEAVCCYSTSKLCLLLSRVFSKVDVQLNLY